MCFSPQRRAIFRHRNFKKWSEPVSFLAFWLWNVLLATAACNFSTSQLQKMVRTWHVLYILTSKCASRYSGVQFFLRPLQSYLRTRRFSEVTFRPSRHTKHWKTQHFATSLTFRACWSSFFPHLLIFFLAALLFQLSILSEVRLLNFLRTYCILYHGTIQKENPVQCRDTSLLSKLNNFFKGQHAHETKRYPRWDLRQRSDKLALTTSYWNPRVASKPVPQRMSLGLKKTTALWKVWGKILGKQKSEGIMQCIAWNTHTRWASTSYKWSYDPNKCVAGVINPISGVINPTYNW